MSLCISKWHCKCLCRDLFTSKRNYWSEERHNKPPWLTCSEITCPKINSCISCKHSKNITLVIYRITHKLTPTLR